MQWEKHTLCCSCSVPVLCHYGTPCRDVCACVKNTDHLEDEEIFRAAESDAVSGKKRRGWHTCWSPGGNASFVVLWVSLCLCALAFPPNLESGSYLFWCVTCTLVGGDSRGNNRREGVCLHQISPSNSICSQHLESIMVYSVRWAY